MAAAALLERGDPWRWVVLALFCLYSASNAIQWITYSSIATAARAFFNLTTNQLNMLSSVYMIVFIVGAYFTCTTFERWGVRLGVLIGCSFNALGSILKVAPGLQVPCYTTLIVPQALNSIAQLFVLSTPPLIAAQYFAPHQRTFATAIAATANSLGNAVALFAPPLIVKEGIHAEFMLLFCLEMGLCVLITIGVVFFLRPPSFQAPSKALLGELASARGASVVSAGSRPVSLPRRGQREEEAATQERHDSHVRSSSSTSGSKDGHSRSSSGESYSRHDSQQAVFQRPGTCKDQSRTASAEPIHHTRAVSSHNKGSRAGNTAPPPLATSEVTVPLKPARAHAAYSVQDGVVDQTTAPYEFDRGSLSKHKKMTVWRRIRHNEHVVTFLEVGHDIYLLLRRRDFVFLLGAFGVSMGSVWTFASVLAQILEPFGVSAQLSGIIGAVNVVVGTIVSYLVGLWVDRTRLYRYPLLACLVGSVLCCVGLMVIMLRAPAFTRTMDGLCSFIYVFAGVFQNTAIPICFEFAMEISYPLSESVPGALLMAGANLCSLIMLSISSAMLGNGVAAKSACVNVLILITCVCFAGAILAFFPREKLYRRDAEVEARQRLAADAANSDGGSVASAAAAALPPVLTRTAEAKATLSRKNFADEDLVMEGPQDDAAAGVRGPHGIERDDVNGATPELVQGGSNDVESRHQ